MLVNLMDSSIKKYNNKFSEQLDLIQKAIPQETSERLKGLRNSISEMGQRETELFAKLDENLGSILELGLKLLRDRMKE